MEHAISHGDTEYTEMHGEPDASVKSPCPLCVSVVKQDVFPPQGHCLNRSQWYTKGDNWLISTEQARWASLFVSNDR